MRGVTKNGRPGKFTTKLSFSFDFREGLTFNVHFFQPSKKRDIFSCQSISVASRAKEKVTMRREVVVLLASLGFATAGYTDIPCQWKSRTGSTFGTSFSPQE